MNGSSIERRRFFSSSPQDKGFGILPSDDFGTRFLRLIRGGHELPIEERSKVVEIRGIKAKDYPYVISWVSHPEVQKHLSPVPKVPDNWRNNLEVAESMAEISDYYNNKGEPRKIKPLVAVNVLGEPLGVLTIRWRADPYVPVNERIASIERLIVDPRYQRRNIGRVLMVSAIEYAFNDYRGYTFQPAQEIRIWVMTDAKARPWDRNVEFFREMGFQTVPPKHDAEGKLITPHWKEYQEARKDMPYDGRDATWYQVLPDWYRRQKLNSEKLKGIAPFKVT